MNTQIKEVAQSNPPLDRYIEIRLTGKLGKDEYATFVPVIERKIEEEGTVNLLVLFEDFKGWSTGGLWEDIKFDVKHFNDIEKLAMVGDSKWEKAMATFCKPFTTADVRFFESGDTAEARRWLEQIVPTS